MEKPGHGGFELGFGGVMRSVWRASQCRDSGPGMLGRHGMLGMYRSISTRHCNWNLTSQTLFSNFFFPRYSTWLFSSKINLIFQELVRFLRTYYFYFMWLVNSIVEKISSIDKKKNFSKLVFRSLRELRMCLPCKIADFKHVKGLQF